VQLLKQIPQGFVCKVRSTEVCLNIVQTRDNALVDCAWWKFLTTTWSFRFITVAAVSLVLVKINHPGTRLAKPHLNQVVADLSTSHLVVKTSHFANMG